MPYDFTKEFGAFAGAKATKSERAGFVWTPVERDAAKLATLLLKTTLGEFQRSACRRFAADVIRKHGQKYPPGFNELLPLEERPETRATAKRDEALVAQIRQELGGVRLPASTERLLRDIVIVLTGKASESTE